MIVLPTNAHDRVRERTRLIRAARDRINPAAVGLPSLGRRRVAGLRRHEVAELAGISETWYTRFELGRAQLSSAALARVADVLNLSAYDRCRLLALAFPEWAAALNALAEHGSRPLTPQ